MQLKKPKKVSKTTLRNKADKLFSLFIRHIGICQLKGKDSVRCGGALQCAHIIGRGNTILRYDDENALSICQGHHVFYTYHPHLWEELIKKNWPVRWVHLTHRENETVKKTEELYKEVIEKYS